MQIPNRKLLPETKRILIYRLGSLGDTIVALPAFHLIASAFPHAKRYLLGNQISSSKASHTSMILGESGLIHKYISYPVGLRNLQQLAGLRKRIKALHPDTLIYLAAARGQMKAFRDALFFKSCGIKQIIGVPYTKKLQQNQWLPGKECYEYEGSRLIRCLKILGSINLDDRESWKLHLTVQEKARAQEILCQTKQYFPIIACSVGTKVDVNNWGLAKWQTLIERLYLRFNHATLVFVGASDEYDLSERAGKSWSGQKINLCGALTPRESAAVLQEAVIFIGHDSGPMHLAAAMGTNCVAIFSARNKPGVWFPYGNQHHIIYHKTECYGCRLEVCKHEAKKCITSIMVEEVEKAVLTLLKKQRHWVLS